MTLWTPKVVGDHEVWYRTFDSISQSQLTTSLASFRKHSDLLAENRTILVPSCTT